MPRPLGIGNADTLQQRARFFGYKRQYAHLCRAWLDPEVAASFEQYVEHEESVRDQLADLVRSGKSLRDWKRVFLLDQSLKPTRAQVIRLSIERPTFGDDWFIQHHVLASGSDINARNRATAEALLASLQLHHGGGDPRWSEEESHKLGRTSLRSFFERFLSQYTMYEADQPGFTALQLVIDEHLEEYGDSECLVYQMAGGRSRRRAVNESGSVEIMQGRNPRDPTLYPGDREFRQRELPTVQIHRLSLRDQSDGLIESDVCAIAIWVPSWLAADVVVER